MKKNKLKLQKSKALRSNWLITFTSTILGVVFGLVITDYYTSRSKLKNRDIALGLISKEIESNNEMLTEYKEQIVRLDESLKYLLSSFRGDKVMIHKDSIETYNNKAASFFPIKNKINIRDSIEIEYYVIIMHDINSLIGRDLSLIAWETYKNTDYLELTDFKHISDLQGVYNRYLNFNLNNKEWKKLYYNPNKLTQKEGVQKASNLLHKLRLNLKLINGSNKGKNKIQGI